MPVTRTLAISAFAISWVYNMYFSFVPLFLESSEDNLDLLTQTALDYADLLKKMRRKSDASKIEARIRAVTGKTPAPKKKVS